MQNQREEIVLRCPLCILSTVSLPLINESGVELISNPQRLHTLRGGKFFLISGSRKKPIVKEVSAESLCLYCNPAPLPAFGFEPGNIVWISRTGITNYQDRIIKELPAVIAQRCA